ncbi:uncharacterized protein M421DRAFT_96423 [Didymella exigua CBS 183.55]|uniref:ATP-grasp domain-containing protein n=1 Tax=Didymella exigua CBS 183.55 TaxID=1150837 RepID=A0A6A5R8L7_9PLEO|nr:uncharacterized protein M421DRAFT_96423 [Didymella exigua CBS 183.55]KAF1923046.1 hypothetical protein M421DRAFT_96423 [Didymella exigua CBS 183.55]
MPNIITAQRAGESSEARFEFSWRDDSTTDTSSSTSWQTVFLCYRQISTSPDFVWPKNTRDVRLSIESSASERHEIDSRDFGSTAALHLVISALSAAFERESGSVLGLIIPAVAGYIVRSDIIPLRLVNCLLVEKAVSFAQPHQRYAGKRVNIEELRLPDAFAASAAGLLLKQDDSASTVTYESLSRSLNVALRNRLSFPWLSAQEPKRKTLVLVEGGRSGPENGGTGETIYTAAYALGIDIVVFDNPGHWMDDPRYAHWCKQFVSFELLLQPPDDFPNRIVEAVRSLQYPIDGIVTFCDHYKAPVAEAALQLSLPTYSPDAYDIATDKFKTSILEGHHAYRASSVEEAHAIVQKHRLPFPLIIKPCNGFLSEGVCRVENLGHLEIGVQAINTDRHGKEFVIEKYCEGPELDANFVLCNGALLFFEASDDFPKSADVNGQGNVKTFIELANVLPSKLPERELTVLRDSLHRSLLRMGFQDGFYHLEARMENSSMEYAIKDGVFDLVERAVPVEEAPSAWLIEVNPRPPGIQESSAVKFTYGIDYFGLGLLFALDEKDRVKQLAHPFEQGAQYWCEMVFIPVEHGGVYESGDVCAELFERRPDLADHVSECFCFLKKGATLSVTGGVNAWVAYFIVYSRKSRAHVLEVGETIRREVRFSIV